MSDTTASQRFSPESLAARKTLRRWHLDPLAFVTEALQAQPEPWQADSLRALAISDRLSIRAGHGVGKTTDLAWIVLWFMCTRVPFKVPIVANSQDQLRDVVWPEIRKWHGRLPETLGAKMVLFANPTRSSGFFYDTHHGMRDRWSTMRVNSEDVPRAQGHIDDIAAKYGKDSNAYRVRVLGEFPDTEDDAVIPLHLCEAAARRKVAATDYRPVWGVDVARFGDDRSALAKRQGNTLLEPVRAWHGKDTMQLTGLIVEEWKLTHELDRPSEILVDVIGLGAGVVDRLGELGLPVRGVNVGEAAAISDRFMRLRDELWFRARDWLAGGSSVLPQDDQALIAELSAPKYRIESTGKVKVEAKDEMKKRGHRSPDLADAFCLTFAGGLDRKPDEMVDKYRRKLYGGKRRSAWAA